MSGETCTRTVLNEYECHHGALVAFRTLTHPDGTIDRECRITAHHGGTVTLDETSVFEVLAVLDLIRGGFEA